MLAASRTQVSFLSLFYLYHCFPTRIPGKLLFLTFLIKLIFHIECLAIMCFKTLSSIFFTLKGFCKKIKGLMGFPGPFFIFKGFPRGKRLGSTALHGHLIFNAGCTFAFTFTKSQRTTTAEGRCRPNHKSTPAKVLLIMSSHLVSRLT